MLWGLLNVISEDYINSVEVSFGGVWCFCWYVDSCDNQVYVLGCNLTMG